MQYSVRHQSHQNQPLHAQSLPAYVHHPVPRRVAKLDLIHESLSLSTKASFSDIAQVGSSPMLSGVPSDCSHGEGWRSFATSPSPGTPEVVRISSPNVSPPDVAVSPGSSSVETQGEMVYGPRFDYPPMSTSPVAESAAYIRVSTSAGNVQGATQSACISPHAQLCAQAMAAPLSSHDSHNVVESSQTNVHANDTPHEPVQTNMSETINCLAAVDIEEENITDSQYSKRQQETVHCENDSWPKFLDISDGSGDTLQTASLEVIHEAISVMGLPSSDSEDSSQALETNATCDSLSFNTIGREEYDYTTREGSPTAAVIVTTSSPLASDPTVAGPCQLPTLYDGSAGSEAGLRHLSPCQHEQSLRRITSKEHSPDCTATHTRAPITAIEDNIHEPHKFYHPERFVGRLARPQVPSAAPIVQLSVHDGPRRRGRPRKKARDGRANIRALPDYFSDPIVE
ncbi:hypothetical protein EV126DRAFT_4731 [Verticillium dahliae]|nr:hypothetical protein EV126DRAFT_4731 [Verticillium dahliae]